MSSLKSAHARTPVNGVFSSPMTNNKSTYCTFWWKSSHVLIVGSGGGGGGEREEAYAIMDFKFGIFTGHFPVTLQQWKE